MIIGTLITDSNPPVQTKDNLIVSLQHIFNLSGSSGIYLSECVSASEAWLAKPINLVQSLFLDFKSLVTALQADVFKDIIW